MKIYNNLGTDMQVRLRSAILIYDAETRKKNALDTVNQPDRETLAIVHPVEHGILGPGCSATVAAVQQLAIALLGSAGGTHFIPENIIASGIDCLAWHSLPSRRQMWFESQAKEPELAKVSGEVFPQPHLLFMVDGRSFRVFALRTNGRRPTDASRLYHSPYWNVNDSGSLCMGSTAFPKDIVPANIPAFETAFFNSRFTHSTMRGRRQTRTVFQKLWPSLANKRRFPPEQLLPSSQTIRQLLK